MAPDHKLWRDIGKVCGWKHPRAPSVKWLRKEKATEAVLVFLRNTRVGCISMRRKLLEEDRDGAERGWKKRRVSRALPKMFCFVFNQLYLMCCS